MAETDHVKPDVDDSNNNTWNKELEKETKTGVWKTVSLRFPILKIKRKKSNREIDISFLPHSSMKSTDHSAKFL